MFTKSRAMAAPYTVSDRLDRILGVEHGTRSKYTNEGCRCGPCKAAGSAYLRQWRARNSEKVVAYRAGLKDRDQIPHGKPTAYTNYGCRCPECWAAFQPYCRRRRARMRGGESAPYRRDDIFTRDRGQCHICQKSVSKVDWHLDHLIPISAGGADAEWNVAVSHPACNIRRGPGRTPAQLRLAVSP